MYIILRFLFFKLISYLPINFVRQYIINQNKKLICQRNDVSKSSFNEIPITTKKKLRENSNNYKSNENRKNVFKLKTSGSSGEPLVLYTSIYAHLISHIKFFLILARNGYRPWHKLTMLTRYEPGHEFDIKKKFSIVSVLNQIKLFRVNIISVFNNQSKIFSLILEQKPHTLVLTPNVARLLINYIDKKNTKIKIPHVLTMSENIDEELTDLIKNKLCTHHTDLYGCIESPSIAWSSKLSRGEKIIDITSHLIELTERVNIDGVTYGKIILSDIHNSVFPISRYDIGDYAEVIDHDRQFHHRFGRIIGRIDDIIKTKTGRLITFQHVNQLFLGVENITQYKLTESKGEITLWFNTNQEDKIPYLIKQLKKIWVTKYADEAVNIKFDNNLGNVNINGKFKVLEKVS